MALIEAQEVDVMEEMVQKSQDELATKRARTSQNNSKGGKNNYNSNKSNVECYYYHKYGHYASECQKKQVDQSKKNANVADVNMGNAKNYNFNKRNIEGYQCHKYRHNGSES